MKELKKCNLCEYKDFTKLYETKDRMYNLEGKFNLVNCNNCNLKFLNPQPELKDLSKHYPKTYHSLSIEVKRSKFAEFIYNLYFSKNKNYLLKLIFSPIYFLVRGTNVI